MFRWVGMGKGKSREAALLSWASTTLRRGSDRIDAIATATSARPSLDTSRSDFDETVHEALISAAHIGDEVSVVVVCIDYFDVLRSSHGLAVAESVAATVSARIRTVARLGDAVAPSGDDGFAVLWAPPAAAPNVQEMATRISRQFEKPMSTPIGQLSVTVSIGVSSVAGGACANLAPAALQRQARSAVQSAQRAGRSQLQFFDHTIQDQALASYQTERHLRSDIHGHRLGVDFQPIFSLHSGDVVGVETLARWNHDVLGDVSPATFIPIAEESGLMGELGRSVFQSAINQGRTWSETEASPFVTVNLSNRQLLDPDLIPMIQLLLRESSLKPNQLCLEISESVVMSDVAASMTILGHMKDIGLRLAIDDFGTGYSSLSYLRRLPVDMLKIDQSFVQSVYNREDRTITKAIIDLAHTLGMTTVAEGVETRLQVEVLHALDCDMAQGFYLHAPTPVDYISFTPIDFETDLNESPDSPFALEAITGSSFRQSR